ncbi:MAG: hypothetical protein QW650_05050 [Thermofilum sp.]
MGDLHICEICLEKSEVLIRCRLCGREVCPEDFDEARGVCAACSETLCQICGERLSVGYCEECGRLTCRECSIEHGPALLCLECAAKKGSSPDHLNVRR